MSWFGWKKRCQQLESENQSLRRENTTLKKANAALQGQNRLLAEALAAATKNSRNSSKPPSSDIVKPPKDKKPRGKKCRRKIGGQKGHPKHEHTPFAPDQIDQHIPYRLRFCPVNRSHRIIPAEDHKRPLQQVELAPKPIVITEHTAYGIW